MANEVAEKIIEALLALPEDDRAAAIAEIHRNDIFCWQCGYGTREEPNRHCQCWNDE